jgi:pimeloyl-ACP methyl ester carboxylesterase
MPAKISLLLVPGLNCTARLWQAQIEALADIAEPMIADVTGHDSMGALADAVLRRAPPRFALAGLSMGGYVSFEIMRRAPERVERLALVDTNARPDSPEAAERRRRLIDLARSGQFEKVLTIVPWTDFVATTRAADDSLGAVIYGMAQEIGPQAYVRQQIANAARPDSRPLLTAIRCPTIVLVGDDDRITPPELAEEMAAAIAGAKLVVVADCGHLSPLERPLEVSRAMREWLATE